MSQCCACALVRFWHKQHFGIRKHHAFVLNTCLCRHKNVWKCPQLSLKISRGVTWTAVSCWALLAVITPPPSPPPPNVKTGSWAYSGVWTWYDTFGTDVKLGWICGLQKRHMQTWYPGDRAAAENNLLLNLSRTKWLMVDFRKKEATQTPVCISAAGEHIWVPGNQRQRQPVSTHPDTTLIQKEHRNGSTSLWNLRRFNSGFFVFVCGPRQGGSEPARTSLVPSTETTAPSHSVFTLLPPDNRYRSFCCRSTRRQSSFTFQATIFYYIATIQFILNLESDSFENQLTEISTCGENLGLSNKRNTSFFPPYFIVQLVCLKSQHSVPVKEICSHHYITAYFMTAYALHEPSGAFLHSGVSSWWICISVSPCLRRRWEENEWGNRDAEC